MGSSCVCQKYEEHSDLILTINSRKRIPLNVKGINEPIETFNTLITKEDEFYTMNSLKTEMEINNFNESNPENMFNYLNEVRMHPEENFIKFKQFINTINECNIKGDKKLSINGTMSGNNSDCVLYEFKNFSTLKEIKDHLENLKSQITENFNEPLIFCEKLSELILQNNSLNFINLNPINFSINLELILPMIDPENSIFILLLELPTDQAISIIKNNFKFAGILTENEKTIFLFGNRNKTSISIK